MNADARLYVVGDVFYRDGSNTRQDRRSSVHEMPVQPSDHEDLSRALVGLAGANVAVTVYGEPRDLALR
jgi:hypothetical protein